MVDEDDKERIRLAEGDLAQTNDFIKGVLAIAAGLRASVVTLWLALLGFCVQQHLAELGWLAVGVVMLFWIVDGYHGWLYSEALRHARIVERILSDYFNVLSRYRDNPDVLVKFRARLRAHRYGHYRSFTTRFRPSDLLKARPLLFYRVFYPALALAAAAIALGVELSSGPASQPGREFHGPNFHAPEHGSYSRALGSPTRRPHPGD